MNQELKSNQLIKRQQALFDQIIAKYGDQFHSICLDKAQKGSSIENCVVFGLPKKKPLSELKDSEVLPTEIDVPGIGVMKVDVQETRIATLDGNFIDGYLNQEINSSIDQAQEQASLSKNYPHYLLDGFLDPSSGVNYEASIETMGHSEESPTPIENWKYAEVNQTDDGSLLWTQIYTRCASESSRDLSPQNQKNDFIKSGIVISAEGMGGAIGTLGALVVDKDDNSLCALTNGHVVSKNLFVTKKRVGEYSENILGKKVYHGDLVQQNRDAWTEDDQIGIIKKSVPLGIVGTDTSADLFTAEDVSCDAALIAIKASKVNVDSWKLAGDDANALMNQAAKFMDAEDFSFFLEDSMAYNYISDIGGGKKDEPLMVFSGRSSGFHNSHENNNRIRSLGPAYGVKVGYSQGGVTKYLWIRGAFVIADQDWDFRYADHVDGAEGDPQISQGSLFCQNTIMAGDSGSVIYAYTNTFAKNSDGSPHKIAVPQNEAVLNELNRTADANGKWTKTLTEVMEDLGINSVVSHIYYDFGPHIAQKLDTSLLSEDNVLKALQGQTLDPNGDNGTEKRWRMAGQAFAAEIVTQDIINEEGESETIQYSTRGFCQPMHRIADLLNIKEWDGGLDNINYNIREDNSYTESLVFSKGQSDVYNISLNEKNYYQAGGITKAEGREYTAAIEAKTNLTKSNYPFDETMPPLSEWMTFDSFDIEVAEGGSVQSGLNNPRKYPIWLKLNNLSIDLSKLPEEVLRMPTGAMHMDAVLMDANAVFNVEDWYTDTKLSGMPDQGLFYHQENSTTKAYASWRIFSRAGEIASKDTVKKSYPLYLKEFDGKTKFKGYQIKFPLGGGIGYDFDLDQTSQTYSFNKEKTELSAYFEYLPWTVSGNSISFNATPNDIESWLGTKSLKLVFVLWKNDTFDVGNSTRIGRSVNFSRQTQSYLIQTTAIADDITSADVVSYTPGIQESDDKLSRYESLDQAQRKLRILFDSDHLGGPNPHKGIKDSNGLSVGNKFKCQQIKLSQSASKYTYKFETTAIATKGFQELMPGAVLTIDWSDAPDHPVGISTTPDGTHGGGDLYSEVEIDLATKTTKCYFKMADTLGGEYYVPDSAAPGLKEFRTTTKLDFYVYCTSHSGMGFPLQFIDIRDDHKELYINSWLPKKIFLPINHVGPGGATILWNSLDRTSDVLPVVNLEGNTKFSARQMYWTATELTGASTYNGWRHPYNPWRDDWTLESSDANLAKCLNYGDCEDLQQAQRTTYVDEAEIGTDDAYSNQEKFNLHGQGWEMNDKVNDLTYSLDNQWIILEENQVQRGDVFEVVVLGDVRSFGLHEDWFNENNELKSFSRNKDKWAKKYLAAYKSSFSFGIKNISYPSWIDCKWYHTFDGSSLDTISGLNKPISNPSVMVNTFSNLVNVLDHTSFNLAFSDFSNAQIMEQIFANSRISSDLQKIVFDSNYQITNGIAENLAELAERSGCQLEIKQANLAKYNARFNEFAIVERALDPADTTVVFAESLVDFAVGVEIKFLRDRTFGNGDTITAGTVIEISGYTEGNLNFQINYLDVIRDISTSELDDLYEFVNGDKPVLYFNGGSLPSVDLQQRLLAAGVVAHIGRSSSLGKIKDLTKYFAGKSVNGQDLNYLIGLINQRGIDPNANFTKFCYNANISNADFSSITLESPDFTKMFQGSIISGLKLPTVLNGAYSVKDMFESSTITGTLDLDAIVDVGTESVESCFYNTTTSTSIDITSWKFSEIKLFEYMDEFILNSYLHDFKVSQTSQSIILNSADFWFRSLNITDVRKVGRSEYRTYEDTSNGVYIPYEDDTEWNNFNRIGVEPGEEDFSDPDWTWKPVGKIKNSWFEMDHSPDYSTWSWRNDGGQDLYDGDGQWYNGKFLTNLTFDDVTTDYDSAIRGFGRFDFEVDEVEWNHLNGSPTNTFATRSAHLRLNWETNNFEIVNGYRDILTIISDAGNYTGGINGNFSATPDLFPSGKGVQKYITQTNGLEVFTSHIKLELTLDVYRLHFFVHLGKYYNSESKLFSYDKYKGVNGKFPMVHFYFEKQVNDFTESEKSEIYNYIETLNIKDYAVSPTNPRYNITNKKYANESPFLFGPKIADKYLTISEQYSNTGGTGTPARFYSKNVSFGEGGSGDVEVLDVRAKFYPYNLLSENKLTENNELHIPVPFVEYNSWNHGTQNSYAYPLMLRWGGVEEDVHLRFLGSYIQSMGNHPMYDLSIRNKNVKSEPAQIYVIADGTEVLGETYYITNGSSVQAIELEEQNILILVLGIEILDVNSIESNQITQRLEAWVDSMITINQPYPDMDPSYYVIDYSGLETALQDAVSSTNNFEVFIPGWTVDPQQVFLTLFYPRWNTDFNKGTSALSSLSLYKDADRTIPANSDGGYVYAGNGQHLLNLYYKWSYSYDTQDFLRPGSLIVLDPSETDITYTTNTTNNSTTTITPSNICMVVKVDKNNIYFVKTGDTVNVSNDSINYGVHDNNDFSGFAFRAPNIGMSPTVDLIVTGGTTEEPTYAKHSEYPSLSKSLRNTTFHKITPRIMHTDQSWTSVTNNDWEENKVYFTAQKTNGETLDGTIILHPIREGEDEGKLIDQYPIGETEKLFGVKGTYAIYIDSNDFQDTNFYKAELESEYESVLDIPTIDSSKYDEYPVPKSNLGHYKGAVGSKWVILNYDPLEDGFTKIRGKYTNGNNEVLSTAPFQKFNHIIGLVPNGEYNNPYDPGKDSLRDSLDSDFDGYPDIIDPAPFDQSIPGNTIITVEYHDATEYQNAYASFGLGSHKGDFGSSGRLSSDVQTINMFNDDPSNITQLYNWNAGANQVTIALVAGDVEIEDDWQNHDLPVTYPWTSPTYTQTHDGFGIPDGVLINWGDGQVTSAHVNNADSYVEETKELLGYSQNFYSGSVPQDQWKNLEPGTYRIYFFKHTYLDAGDKTVNITGPLKHFTIMADDIGQMGVDERDRSRNLGLVSKSLLSNSEYLNWTESNFRIKGFSVVGGADTFTLGSPFYSLFPRDFFDDDRDEVIEAHIDGISWIKEPILYQHARPSAWTLPSDITFRSYVWETNWGENSQEGVSNDYIDQTWHANNYKFSSYFINDLGVPAGLNNNQWTQGFYEGEFFWSSFSSPITPLGIMTSLLSTYPYGSESDRYSNSDLQSIWVKNPNHLPQSDFFDWDETSPVVAGDMIGCLGQELSLTPQILIDNISDNNEEFLEKIKDAVGSGNTHNLETEFGYLYYEMHIDRNNKAPDGIIRDDTGQIADTMTAYGVYQSRVHQPPTETDFIDFDGTQTDGTYLAYGDWQFTGNMQYEYDVRGSTKTLKSADHKNDRFRVLWLPSIGDQEKITVTLTGDGTSTVATLFIAAAASQVYQNSNIQSTVPSEISGHNPLFNVPIIYSEIILPSGWTWELELKIDLYLNEKHMFKTRKLINGNHVETKTCPSETWLVVERNDTEITVVPNNLKSIFNREQDELLNDSLHQRVMTQIDGANSTGFIGKDLYYDVLLDHEKASNADYGHATDGSLVLNHDISSLPLVKLLGSNNHTDFRQWNRNSSNPISSFVSSNDSPVLLNNVHYLEATGTALTNSYGQTRTTVTRDSELAVLAWNKLNANGNVPSSISYTFEDIGYANSTTYQAGEHPLNEKFEGLIRNDLNLGKKIIKYHNYGNPHTGFGVFFNHTRKEIVDWSWGSYSAQNKHIDGTTGHISPLMFSDVGMFEPVLTSYHTGGLRNRFVPNSRVYNEIQNPFFNPSALLKEQNILKRVEIAVPSFSWTDPESEWAEPSASLKFLDVIDRYKGGEEGVMKLLEDSQLAGVFNGDGHYATSRFGSTHQFRFKDLIKSESIQNKPQLIKITTIQEGGSYGRSQLAMPVGLIEGGSKIVLGLITQDTGNSLYFYDSVQGSYHLYNSLNSLTPKVSHRNWLVYHSMYYNRIEGIAAFAVFNVSDRGTVWDVYKEDLYEWNLKYTNSKNPLKLKLKFSERGSFWEKTKPKHHDPDIVNTNQTRKYFGLDCSQPMKVLAPTVGASNRYNENEYIQDYTWSNVSADLSSITLPAKSSNNDGSGSHYTMNYMVNLGQGNLIPAGAFNCYGCNDMVTLKDDLWANPPIPFGPSSYSFSSFGFMRRNDGFVYSNAFEQRVYSSGRSFTTAPQYNNINTGLPPFFVGRFPARKISELQGTSVIFRCESASENGKFIQKPLSILERIPSRKNMTVYGRYGDLMRGGDKSLLENNYNDHNLSNFSESLMFFADNLSNPSGSGIGSGLNKKNKIEYIDLSKMVVFNGASRMLGGFFNNLIVDDLDLSSIDLTNNSITTPCIEGAKIKNLKYFTINDDNLSVETLLGSRLDMTSKLEELHTNLNKPSSLPIEDRYWYKILRPHLSGDKNWGADASPYIYGTTNYPDGVSSWPQPEMGQLYKHSTDAYGYINSYGNNIRLGIVKMDSGPKNFYNGDWSAGDIVWMGMSVAEDIDESGELYIEGSTLPGGKIILKKAGSTDAVSHGGQTYTYTAIAPELEHSIPSYNYNWSDSKNRRFRFTNQFIKMDFDLRDDVQLKCDYTHYQNKSLTQIINELPKKYYKDGEYYYDFEKARKLMPFLLYRMICTDHLHSTRGSHTFDSTTALEVEASILGSQKTIRSFGTICASEFSSLENLDMSNVKARYAGIHNLSVHGMNIKKGANLDIGWMKHLPQFGGNPAHNRRSGNPLVFNIDCYVNSQSKFLDWIESFEKLKDSEIQMPSWFIGSRNEKYLNEFYDYLKSTGEYSANTGDMSTTVAGSPPIDSDALGSFSNARYAKSLYFLSDTENADDNQIPLPDHLNVTISNYDFVIERGARYKYSLLFNYEPIVLKSFMDNNSWPNSQDYIKEGRNKLGPLSSYSIARPHINIGRADLENYGYYSRLWMQK